MISTLLTRLGLQPLVPAADGTGGLFSGVCAGDWFPQPRGPVIEATNPATGETLARVQTADRHDYDQVVERAAAAFLSWRKLPAPQRGEYIRRLGLALREQQSLLGELVTLEVGKIPAEGVGEVQEMIDIADFAVGLSRQLHGLTIASERPEHRLLEQWHPLGTIGLITAFNFPVAVWAWNAALAAVCGDAVVWKPSPLTPLTALAVQQICQRVMAGSGLEGVFSLCIGADRDVGLWMADDPRLPLVSATGSSAMGQEIGGRVARRLGRSLLELGGNNAAIVTESAEIELAVRAIVFAAVGTAGQRCTTLRRLFVHESRLEPLLARLQAIYTRLPIGNPTAPGVLVGPLIRPAAQAAFTRAIEQAVQQGGTLVCGGDQRPGPGWYVTPAIVRAAAPLPIMQEETFAPLLYVVPYQSLEQAIRWQNESAHGLSSAIFTERFREAERFLAVDGSDCGIANVNIGTSGAEIGGAFGGEKATGGGRESGSDAWKVYMRRQTCTLNYGTTLPLAQGIRFEVE